MTLNNNKWQPLATKERTNKRKDLIESYKFTTDYRPTFNENRIGHYLNVELCISIIFIFESHILVLKDGKKPTATTTAMIAIKIIMQNYVTHTPLSGAENIATTKKKKTHKTEINGQKQHFIQSQSVRRTFNTSIVTLHFILIFDIDNTLAHATCK